MCLCLTRSTLCSQTGLTRLNRDEFERRPAYEVLLRHQALKNGRKNFSGVLDTDGVGVSLHYIGSAPGGLTKMCETR